MRRFAYLLANNDGLPGIKKDMEDYRSFLMGCSGGAWDPGEIVSRYNISLATLQVDLSAIRAEHYDYVVFYYSGHGDWKRETRLYINEKDECIAEGSVVGLAPRQLSIFDCCRVSSSSATKGLTEVFDEAITNDSVRRNWARSKFDNLVMGVPAQEVRLYACKLNQCAFATENGSLYTQALLSVASAESRSSDITAVKVHDASCPIVSVKASVLGETQCPDRTTNGSDSRSLPFAIRPPQILFG